MKKDNIILLLGDILKNELELDIKNLEVGKSLLELGIDSISFMSLIVYVEDKLSIELDLANIFFIEYSKITIDMLVEEILNIVES